jgi:hypothetical protein
MERVPFEELRKLQEFATFAAPRFDNNFDNNAGGRL